MFATEEACCAPQGPAGEPLAAIPGAFPEGCGNVTKAAEPCWVVDTYWPSRQCRQSRTLCGAGEGHSCPVCKHTFGCAQLASGVQSEQSKRSMWYRSGGFVGGITEQKLSRPMPPFCGRAGTLLQQIGCVTAITLDGRLCVTDHVC